jgi:hypothetical protein
MALALSPAPTRFPSDLDLVVGELALAPHVDVTGDSCLAACGCPVDDPSPVPSALIAFF